MSQHAESAIAISAAPERVWQAWVEEINQWWTKPYYNDHSLVTGLHMEPGLGGRLIEKWGETGSGFLIGTIVEWLPPLRMAYTWTERGWGGAQTFVRVEFTEDGRGGTLMRLEHHGFERLPEGAQQRQGYQQGWGDLLTKARNFLEKPS